MFNEHHDNLLEPFALGTTNDFIKSRWLTKSRHFIWYILTGERIVYNNLIISTLLHYLIQGCPSFVHSSTCVLTVGHRHDVSWRSWTEAAEWELTSKWNNIRNRKRLQCVYFAHQLLITIWKGHVYINQRIMFYSNIWQIIRATEFFANLIKMWLAEIWLIKVWLQFVLFYYITESSSQ